MKMSATSYAGGIRPAWYKSCCTGLQTIPEGAEARRRRNTTKFDIVFNTIIEEHCIIVLLADV